MEQKTNNYEKQAESARIEFLKYDQNTIISRLMPEHNDESIYMQFYNTKYRINRNTGRVSSCTDESPASFEAIMTIYDVLCYSRPFANLSGQWQTLTNLSPHSNFGASDKNLFSKEAKAFAGKSDQLMTRCQQLGGRESTKADVGFEFDAFPFLPVIFQFWDGDDEFDPQISILFDKNTLDFIHFETAWYAAGHLLGLLKQNITV